MSEMADAWAELRTAVLRPFERVVARWPWAGITAYVLLRALVLAVLVGIALEVAP